MGPKYGLAADQVLELEVVLANGTVVTANACQHPALFWALRGGGGSTYGIVTSMTSRIYPVLPINFARLQVEVVEEDKARESMQDLITSLGSHQSNLSKSGVAGYNFVYEGAFTSVQIVADEDGHVLRSVFQPFVDVLSADDRMNVTQVEVSAAPSGKAQRR